MARKPNARTEIGTGTRAAEQQGAERNLLAAGALRARAPQTVSREKCVARPRYEFSCVSLRAHAKEASRAHGERHDRAAIRITA